VRDVQGRPCAVVTNVAVLVMNCVARLVLLLVFVCYESSIEKIEVPRPCCMSCSDGNGGPLYYQPTLAQLPRYASSLTVHQGRLAKAWGKQSTPMFACWRSHPRGQGLSLDVSWSS
jgi:hypothetical protein